MKIIIGDKVAWGSYQCVYSIHHKVCNFLSGDKLLSVCSREVCAGVNRIVLDVDNVTGIESVEVGDGKLYINGKVYCGYGASDVYHSPMMEEIEDYPLLIRNLNTAVSVLMGKCIAESIPGMLQGTLQANTVMYAMKESFGMGVKLLFVGDYSKAVHCFRHLGIGFSPAGDDFLVGLVLGISWVQQTQKKELSKIVDIIIHESDVNNPLIRTFMSQAKALELDADWAGFLCGLMQADESYINEMQRIMKHGASSGEDQLSGFFVACELFCTGMEQRIINTVLKD